MGLILLLGTALRSVEIVMNLENHTRINTIYLNCGLILRPLITTSSPQLTPLIFQVKLESEPESRRFNSILSILSYLLKAPLVPAGTPVVNALFKQRSCIENIIKACIGLQPGNHMLLEHKIGAPLQQVRVV